MMKMVIPSGLLGVIQDGISFHPHALGEGWRKAKLRSELLKYHDTTLEELSLNLQ